MQVKCLDQEHNTDNTISPAIVSFAGVFSVVMQLSSPQTAAHIPLLLFLM